jgi:hypothetical protein
MPSREDEATLRLLAQQLKDASGQKYHLRTTCTRSSISFIDATVNPRLPSSGAEPAALWAAWAGRNSNVDVMEVDACDSSRWFDDRWGDRFSLDVSGDLVRSHR